LGVVLWGFGFWVWAQNPNPKSQNPQSPIPNKIVKENL